jgi:hypothetical protein
MLTRKAPLAPTSYDAEKRLVTVSWGEGAAVNRRDMQGPYIERLSMKPEHVNLSRLQGGPVFLDHVANTRALIGAIERAWIDNGQGFARIKLSSRADVAGHVQDIADGILNSVSVGYAATKWAESTNARGDRVRMAVAWTPHEISFVGVAADPAAKVRSHEQWTPNSKTRRKKPATRINRLAQRRAFRFDPSSGKLAERPSKRTN